MDKLPVSATEQSRESHVSRSSFIGIMKYILKRLNDEQTIVLDRDCYTCGRDKKNNIVCLSPVVSRSHCIFIHKEDGLNILDMGSANGTFVNGTKITPKVYITLSLNDKVGIGCFNLDSLEKQDFVYSLQAFADATHEDNICGTTKRKLEADSTSIVPNKILRAGDPDISTEDDILSEELSPSKVQNERPYASASSTPKERNPVSCPESISPPNEKKTPRMIEDDEGDEDLRELIKKKRRGRGTPMDLTDTVTNGVELISGHPSRPLPNGPSSPVVIKYELDIKDDNCVPSTVVVSDDTPSTSTGPKDEPRLSYSQIDCEEFIDEDEDIFSQKSDSIHNTPDRTNTGDFILENKDEHSDSFTDLFHSQEKEPDIITLSDDDDDEKNNPWWLRLYQSQILNESQIKQEESADDLHLEAALQDLNRMNLPDEVEDEEEINGIVEGIDERVPKADKLEDDLRETTVTIELPKKTKSKPSSSSRESKPSAVKAKSAKDSSDSTIPKKFRKSKESKERKKRQEKTTKARPSISSHDESDHDDFDRKKQKETSEKKSEKSSELLPEKISKKRDSEHEKISVKSYKSTSKSEDESEKRRVSLEEPSTSRRESPESIISRRFSNDKSPLESKSVKKIQQIDPPFLKKGERRGVSCGIKKLNSSTETDASSTLLGNSDDLNVNSGELRSITSKPVKLTAKEKKELANQEKIQDVLYKNEQRRRRLQHRWAECLPPGQRRRSSLSKSQREEIRNDRKEKLKKLADEKKKQSSGDFSEKRAPKPKAKVSNKTRGDFLLEDQEDEDKTGAICKKLPKIVKKTETSITKSKSSSPKLSKISKTLGNKTDNEGGSKSNLKSPRKTKMISSIPESTSKKLTSKEMKQIKQSSIKLIDIFAVDKPGKQKDKEKENRAPNESKRKVTFNPAEPEVRVYEIDPGNTLKKCVQKDALLPQKFSRPANQPADPAINNPKLEEFLLRLFNWNPAWLKEQIIIKEPPPVVNYNALVPLCSAYSSYDDYYRITAPLLALELWNGLSKDFEMNEQRSRHPPIMACISPGTITRQSVPNTDLLLTTFLLQAVVNREQIRGQQHPVMGDLVIFRIVFQKNNTKQYHTIFAYVSQVDQRVITPFTKYNKDLLQHVKNPHTLLTYSMMTKPLPVNVGVDDVQKLMTVSYLRSSMRMIQALQYLPTSPLLRQILKPTVEDYQLPSVSNYDSYSLTTKEKLNTRQLEAVLKITETVVKRIPKICMIQGPPGTGKSKVIVNIVTEILYGNNRYLHHKPTRILVCAPSNAAIDEIVLRLMDIRTNLPKDQRFKMVRIGKQEMMHKSVRSISVSELAKRDVEKTTAEYCNRQNLDTIEEEKNFLKARINAIESELEYSKNKDDNCRQYILRKLTAVRLKYDLLTNPRNVENGINPKQLTKLQRSAENTILSGADVITCTLSSCYTNQMEAIFGGNKDKISVCIVDEATQSAEAETLIPLMLGVNTLVLVGDPNQLPATVISQEAKKLGLDQSLFARLYNAFDGQPSNPVIVLDTQYRMSYPIAYWPNRYFYAGVLKNSANLRSLPFHFYKVINLASTQNNDRFSNTNEAMFIINVIHTMLTHSKLEGLSGTLKVGIITPYNNQKVVLNAKIRDVWSGLAENIRKKVQIEANTVDSFQGQESDVIIMSCVRSAGIGFLSDRQRLCVALTRAKHSLFICGNFRTFERDDMWRTLLADARSRGVYIDVDYAAGPNVIKGHIIK